MATRATNTVLGPLALPSGRNRPLLASTMLSMLVLIACGGESPPAEPTEPAREAPVANAEVEEEADAGVDAGHDAGPPRPPARIFAKRFVTKVRERPDRDSFRIGYLRAGAVLMATTGDPVRSDDPRCPGGWYELTTGGFVCNGRDVIAFWGRRLPHARSVQADRSSPMPYSYGRTRREVPMYRRLPTDADATEFEGFRVPGTTPPADAQVSTTTEGSEGAAPDALPSPSPAEPPEPADPAEPADPITLASLRGDRNSALMRRLVRGFIVSLDREFRAGRYNRRYWRTISNGFVPYGGVGTVSWPNFRGTAIDEVAGLPVGYMLGRNDIFFTRGNDGRPRRGRAVPFQHRLHIVGEEVFQNTTYYTASDGRLYRAQDVRRIEPRERPSQVGPTEKWIEVNLSSQYLIAYEGDRPVYATLLSSGRAYHPGDPQADYLTPTGMFRIRAKHMASAMDGDTAADGPYSIEDVPWVMYFQLAYALHGAFWHERFGFPRSHGCVNLSPRDAQWVFNWSDPQLPEGWHGAYPTDTAPGTWVYVHGETPGARR